MYDPDEEYEEEREERYEPDLEVPEEDPRSNTWEDGTPG